MLKRVNFKNRIAELDLLKGFAVVYMIINHIIYDFGFAFRNSFYGTPLYDFCIKMRDFHNGRLCAVLTYTLCAAIFIGVSGILSTVSRKTFRQGLILAAVSVVITVVSKIASAFAGEDMTIWYGILHLMATCMLLSPLLKRLPLLLLAVLSVICMLGGALLNNAIVAEPNLSFLAVFNVKCVGFFSADYYPLLPFIAYYIAGIYIGRCFYADEPTTKIKFTENKIFFPLRFLGAYTFEIYVLHQGLLYGIIYLISVIVQNAA